MVKRSMYQKRDPITNSLSYRNSSRRLISGRCFTFMKLVTVVFAALLTIHSIRNGWSALDNDTVVQLESNPDSSCIFRNSSIYRSVYVYPSFGDFEGGWYGDILSLDGRNNRSPKWPWLDIDERLRKHAMGHYAVKSRESQYTTELLVRDIFTHPLSCLRANDPETATLFYVPYLPSIEFHNGSLFVNDYSTSPFGQALIDATDGQYEKWEETFGLSSKYWRRRGGADHILVFSEPLHGLSHPRDMRGNYHTIHTQRQLRPPIIISVGVSTTFVKMYPKCSRKNILMPYPNSNGRWYNGKLDEEVSGILQKAGLTNAAKSTASLPAERQLALAENSSGTRPLGQFYSAGRHGTCVALRRSLSKDYKCAPSSLVASKLSDQYAHGYRMATMCPCPGGDSPAAKRMFDAILAGCIPLILSYDFVWPLSIEFDKSHTLDPSEFSVRLDASYYEKSRVRKNCTLKDESLPSLQSMLESIPADEIQRLRLGVKKAAESYSYFRPSSDLPDNPLRERVLPNGGATFALIEALGARSAGRRWPECKAEVSLAPSDTVNTFKC